MSVHAATISGTATNVGLVAVGIGARRRTAPHEKYRYRNEHEKRQEFEKIVHHALLSFALLTGVRRIGKYAAQVHFAPAPCSLAPGDCTAFPHKHHNSDGADCAKADYRHHFVAHLSPLHACVLSIAPVKQKSDVNYGGTRPC